MKANDMFKNENYYQSVEDQLNGMGINELIVADIGSKTVHDFRMNANKACKKLGIKIKTKTKEGKLYVGRIL